MPPEEFVGSFAAFAIGLLANSGIPARALERRWNISSDQKKAVVTDLSGLDKGVVDFAMKPSEQVKGLFVPTDAPMSDDRNPPGEEKPAYWPDEARKDDHEQKT